MKFDQNGLIPAIIQDANSHKVLMLGYMNEESFAKTRETGMVTFYSRSKQRLWTKGESSKNYLHLKSWALDCDKDTLLIKAVPDGPACHTGADTCWGEENNGDSISFLNHLEGIIQDRLDHPSEKSYTTRLLNKGTHKIAQKVGEEAVELIIESLREDDDLFRGEAADLIYHLLVLLKDRGMSMADIVKVLESRHG